MELFASFLGEDSVSPSFLNHYLQGIGFHVIYIPPFGYRSLWWASFPVGHISYSPWVEKNGMAESLDTLSRKYMANPYLDSYLYKRTSANIQKYGLPGMLRLLIPYADEILNSPNNLSAIFQAIVNCCLFWGPVVPYLDFEDFSPNTKIRIMNSRLPSGTGESALLLLLTQARWSDGLGWSLSFESLVHGSVWYKHVSHEKNPTLQGTYTSHHWERNIIFKCTFWILLEGIC